MPTEGKIPTLREISKPEGKAREIGKFWLREGIFRIT